MRQLLAALFIAVAVQASLVLAGRQNAGPKQFPHQVLLNGSSTSVFHLGPRHCAGALISEEWIISSSSCVAGINTIHIYMGTFYFPTQTLYSYVHKSSANMIREKKSADLVLIHMSRSPVENHDYVAPIRLPPQSHATASYSLWKANVSEYAYTGNKYSYEEPQVATIVYSSVRVEPSFLCKAQYESFSNDNICLLSSRSADDEAEPCTRDAGSPLIAMESDGESTLLGIVTAINGTTLSCGKVFTKIAPHLDWISRITGIELRK